MHLHLCMFPPLCMTPGVCAIVCICVRMRARRYLCVYLCVQWGRSGSQWAIARFVMPIHFTAYLLVAFRFVYATYQTSEGETNGMEGQTNGRSSEWKVKRMEGQANGGSN